MKKVCYLLLISGLMSGFQASASEVLSFSKEPVQRRDNDEYGNDERRVGEKCKLSTERDLFGEVGFGSSSKRSDGVHSDGVHSVQNLLDEGGVVIDQYGCLNLSNNDLNSLEGLRNVPGIETVKELRVCHNGLFNLPNLSFMESLESISASHNNLQSIDPVSCTGKNLRYLFLGYNQLTFDGVKKAFVDLGKRANGVLGIYVNNNGPLDGLDENGLNSDGFNDSLGLTRFLGRDERLPFYTTLTVLGGEDPVIAAIREAEARRINKLDEKNGRDVIAQVCHLVQGRYQYDK
jgi:hypothetical protein